MIVIGRKHGQSIKIGDDIEVTFLGFRPDGKARIGIDAPLDRPVYRTEILEEIQAEQEAEESTERV